MSQSLEAFDLKALRARLKSGRYSSLVKLIDQVSAHSAIQMDLQRAALCLSQIRRVEAAASLQKFTDEMGLVTQSLFVNAIFLYTRAIHSRPISRMFVGVEGKYSAAQKDVHRSLTYLRDKCLAHYGPGEISEEDQWVDDRVIYIPNDGQKIQYPFVRYDHHGLITAGLSDLIETAGPAIVVARLGLERKLLVELEALTVTDENFATHLSQCIFDGPAFHRGHVFAADSDIVTIHTPPNPQT